MSGARLKTVTILLMLTVDIILAGVFVWRLASEHRAEVRMVRESAAALERLGFNVSEELLEEERPTLYTRERERSVESEERVAEALLGRVGFTTRGGGIYTAETEHGRLRISNVGLFEVTLAAPYPDGLGADSSADEAASFIALASGETAAVFSNGDQIIDGARVFGRTVELSEDADGLHIGGGVLLGEMYVSDGTHSRSLTAALLALAGKLENDRNGVSETVLSAELGYTAELIAENYTALRPTWLITTDLGEYRVNAVTLDVMD